MVGAVGDVGDGLAGVYRVEDRSDQGHVRQVRAARGGMVRENGVARGYRDAFAHFPDTQTQRPEMDGDVRGARDQLALAIEEGAGEVGAFLHVRGDGGALQHRAHLADEMIEPVPEKLAHDRSRTGRGGCDLHRLAHHDERTVPSTRAVHPGAR